MYYANRAVTMIMCAGKVVWQKEIEDPCKNTCQNCQAACEKRKQCGSCQSRCQDCQTICEKHTQCGACQSRCQDCQTTCEKTTQSCGGNQSIGKS